MKLNQMLWIAAAVIAGAYLNSLVIRPMLNRTVTTKAA